LNKVTLDTNIILAVELDKLLDSFAETTYVVIPFEVIVELDNHKDTYYGRHAIKFLAKLLEKVDDINCPFTYKNHTILICADFSNEYSLGQYIANNKLDVNIMKTAIETKSTLHTSDLHMAIMAKYYGTAVKIIGKEIISLPTGITRLHLNEEQLEACYNNGCIPECKLPYNESIIITDPTGQEHYGRYNGQCITILKDKFNLCGVKPLKHVPEQRMLAKLLTDQTIQLLTVVGPAGSGKTFLALASAIQQVKDGLYQKVVVLRSLDNVDKDIGALPGTKEEKLTPWMAAVYDALDNIPNLKKEELFRAGLIEFEALTYLRGRSISNQIIIVEDGQNLTPKQAATIVTRCGYNSKIIMLGDISDSQIDNCKVSSTSNGLTYVINKLYGTDPVVGHIVLTKTVRSKVAQLGVEHFGGCYE
jgi:PhoH-like ATPase